MRLCVMLAVAALLVAPVSAEASRKSASGDVAPNLNAYAQARLAEGDGELALAVGAFRIALDGDPASSLIARRAYRQAVLAGDRQMALRTARLLDLAGELPRDGVVLLLIDALERRRAEEARTLVNRLESEESLAYLAPFMRSWASLIDGPYDPPVVPADKPYAVFAVRYLEEQLLLQRLALGDLPGAREAYATAKERSIAFLPEQRATLARAFAGLGEREIALELLAGDSGHDHGTLRARIEAGSPFPREKELTPLTGLASLLLRLAADLSGEKSNGVLSIIRIAGFADPQSGDIRLATARSALSLGFLDEALAEAERIAPGSLLWIDAQAVRLSALLQQEKAEEAIGIARMIASRPGAGLAEQRLLANLLLQSNRPAEAAQAYAAALALPGGADDPALLLQYGGALEQAGDWAKARPVLEKAVEKAPSSVVALNHLGYALADRREDLPRAIALLEKANILRPDEPAFVDSLGWAYHRAGQSGRALPLLEKAVAAEPGNSELNEHMGDVLWVLGRRFEARHAWNAALAVLEPDASAARARIDGKIAGRRAP